MKTVAFVVLFAAVYSSAFACGAKTPGLETRPLWQSATAGKSSPASCLVYLVERVSDQLAAVTFRNLGDDELHFCFGLSAVESSQNAVLTPGAQSRFEFKVEHFLNTYFSGSVDVWNVSSGDTISPNEPRPAREAIPTAQPQMYAVYPLEETSTFNPKPIVCLGARKLEDNKVAVQFRNDAQRTVHFDFRIAGFQASDARNPRVTLFPGMEEEMTIGVPNCADPAIESALIEAYNIRIGSDSGPLISPERKEAAPRSVMPNEADLLFANDNVEFNDRTIYQIIDGRKPTKIRVINTGGDTVSFDPLIAAIQTVECPRVSIPAGGEVSLDLERIACRPGRQPRVFVRRVRVGNDEGPCIGELDEPHVAFQEGWLFPTVVGESRLFNSKSIGYGVTDSGNSTVVKFVNFSDSPVHFDFRLPGYQAEADSNARIALGPRPIMLGHAKSNCPANAECAIKVTRKDARLSVAKVQIFNIRIGVEDGDALLREKVVRTETK